MLEIKEALKVIEQERPEFKVKQVVEYQNLFIFRVEKPGVEKDMDPYYAVDRNKGTFEAYPLIYHKDGMSISRKFIEKSD